MRNSCCVCVCVLVCVLCKSYISPLVWRIRKNDFSHVGIWESWKFETLEFWNFEIVGINNTYNILRASPSAAGPFWLLVVCHCVCRDTNTWRQYHLRFKFMEEFLLYWKVGFAASTFFEDFSALKAVLKMKRFLVLSTIQSSWSARAEQFLFFHLFVSISASKRFFLVLLKKH